MHFKPCSKCTHLYPDEYFSPDDRNPTGLQSQCKFCRRETDRRYYHAIKADPKRKAEYLARKRAHYRKRKLRGI